MGLVVLFSYTISSESNISLLLVVLFLFIAATAASALFANFTYKNITELETATSKIAGGKTKKSSYDRVDFEFLSGNSIDIICYDWSEATKFSDHLSVGIESKEFSKWLNDD